MAVPPTAIEQFVVAVPNSPVFALFVGLTEHAEADDASEDETGPALVKPPEPEVIVAVPLQVTA
jgi:hypothetical protein